MKRLFILFLLLSLLLTGCVNPTKNAYGKRETIITEKHSYYDGNYETTSYKIFVELDWYDNEDKPHIETHVLEVDKETYDSIEVGDIAIVNFYWKLSFCVYFVDLIEVMEKEVE